MSETGLPTTDDDRDGRTVMADDVRERREETWERLYVKDEAYADVVASLATQYGVAESTIRADISRMDEWLPKLGAASNSAHSRLRELEQNQQRRREILRDIQAEKEKPPEESNYSAERELRVLDELDQAAQLYVDLAQSVGAIDREPQKHVTKHEGTVDHQLTDQQQQHLQQLKEQSRDAITERDVDIIDVEDVEAGDDDAA